MKYLNKNQKLYINVGGKGQGVFVQISINLTKYNETKNNLVFNSGYLKMKDCRWLIIIGNIKTYEVSVFEKIPFKEKRK